MKVLIDAGGNRSDHADDSVPSDLHVPLYVGDIGGLLEPLHRSVRQGGRRGAHYL